MEPDPAGAHPRSRERALLRHLSRGSTFAVRRAKNASVLARRRAIRSLVFATELRRAVVADGVSHRRDVLGPRKQPRARLLQSNLLQVLERTHQGHSAEMAMERG